MLSRSHLMRPAALATAALALTVGLRAQQPAKADAEFLLKAYETYRAQQHASPYKNGDGHLQR